MTSDELARYQASPIEDVARLAHEVARLQQDAARYQHLLMGVGALRLTSDQSPYFTIRLPKAPDNVMRGSCAGHFSAAIDAALTGSKQQ